MQHRVLHYLTLSLTDDTLPETPFVDSSFLQFDSSRCSLTIRGDISGAPTPQILDDLIARGVVLKSPVWTFSLEGDLDRACAYALGVSPAGDRRDIRLLNPARDLQNSSAGAFQARLKPGYDAEISKTPTGPFSIVGNNLLVSRSTLDTLSLNSAGDVRVKGDLVGWHVVRPGAQSILDPQLSFSPSDARPYRARLANIAKRDAVLAFGLAAESEGWGLNLEESIYLIDLETAAEVIPQGRRVLGDIVLVPVFPYDSPEGEFMQEITERVRRLKVEPANP